MRKLFVLLILINPWNLVAQESPQFATMSYTEFFDAIEQETDSVFRLENVVVVLDTATDKRFLYQTASNGRKIYSSSDSIFIDKEIRLRNVHFAQEPWRQEGHGLNQIHFRNNVVMRSCGSAYFVGCVFDQQLIITGGNDVKHGLNFLADEVQSYGWAIGISNSLVRGHLYLNLNAPDEELNTQVAVDESIVYQDSASFETRIWGHGVYAVGDTVPYLPI